MIDIIPNPGRGHEFPPPLSISFDRASNGGVRTPQGESAIRIAEIRDKNLFSKSYRIGSLIQTSPLKRSGSADYKIPADGAQFIEVLQIIADYEARYSKIHTFKKGSLTVRQNLVAAGKQQADLIWHGDAAFSSMTTDHIYFISDREGSLFQAGPMDHARERLNALNDEQNRPFIKQADPYTVYLMTNHCIHKSPVMKNAGQRTFLRVILSGLEREDMRYVPGEDLFRMGLPG